MTDDYSHPEHGAMEWYQLDELNKEGWKCTKCGVVAPEGEADKTFDRYDCEQYQNVSEGISL